MAETKIFPTNRILYQDHMKREEEARKIVPLPGKLFSCEKFQIVDETKISPRKSNSVSGLHDPKKGSTQNYTTSFSIQNGNIQKLI